MVNILLVCAGGMSSSILAFRMKEAAKERQLDISVNAFSEFQIEKHLENIDVVLVGPQIRFKIKQIENVCINKEIPVAIMDMFDYGRMRADKLIDQALDLVQKK
ncbi:PTS sugar transporter subunit IIB [Clostridium sp. 'White wine YQ']|uniref:PTS sugar transporter subunit IIB n=1 Tax=Clostridium sp. 'White wine YQ' TaxID=3027474 RepID=UPI002366D9DA|nr:PTS sugar transporter subunit IIB [Clostridium sp. 'White wine YQ']MDD7794220.1 PTS sugar transporter subunit IIB [Clostridium sp. 'White wine YQ']